MIEVRIKYTEQDEDSAVSIGEMSLAEANEFFKAFHFDEVHKRNKEWKDWLKNPNANRVMGLPFVPVLHKDTEDDGDGGPVVYGFLHSTLVLPNPNLGETNKPFLLFEYMEV